MKKIIFAFTCLLNGCCYNGTEVLLAEPDFKPENKILIFEDNSLNNSKLRAALHKHGIKVLKYAETETIEKKETIDKNTIHSKKQFYNEVDGRYYLSTNYEYQRDYSCPTNIGTKYYEVFVEITDLNTKEVVFSGVSRGGTKPCAYCPGDIYNRTAEMIADFWLTK